MLWVFVSLFCIVLVKFWSSKQSAKLNRRLDQARRDLVRVKKRLRDAEENLDEVKREMEGHEERISYMRSLIEDIHVRLAQRESRGDRISEAMDTSAKSSVRRAVLDD